MGHHQAGRFSDAAKLYQHVLAKQPKNAEALRLFGLLCLQLGQLNDAFDLIRQSIAVDSQRSETHHNLGDVLRAQGKLDAAVAAYERARQLRPDWAEAHGALGNALYDQHKLPEAAAAYRQAIALKPALPIAHFNLGRVLHEQSLHTDAIAALKKAIELRGNWPEAHNRLGNVLWDENQLDAAADAYTKAIALRPEYPAPNWSLGKILLIQGKPADALVCFQRVVEKNPTLARAYTHLGYALSQMGRPEEANAQYVEAVRLEPDSDLKQFKIAVLSGNNSAKRVPAEYLRTLFDRYADTFDRHLVDRLDYRVPQQLLEAVVADKPGGNWEVLDLGCGTGLCGQQIRSRARWLAGVDIAPAMIRAAAARRIYDELFTDDLIPVLDKKPGSYDVILAGDVLIYVGDVSDLMPAVARALRSGGLFAFSIEHYDGSGYFLHSEERFAHSLPYIRDLAARAGLKEHSVQKVALRKQAGQDVSGYIILLAKDSAA